MIENIKNILSNIKELDEWKIVENKISSRELFFIRQELDMNRGKEVVKYIVTVYKDFEEDGKKYRGSSTVQVHPTMTKEEIKNSIEGAVFAASFVKNEYYPINEGEYLEEVKMESNFDNDTMSNYLPKISKCLFEEDVYEKGCVNSSELFLNKVYIRIVNSKGLDVSYSGYSGMLDLVTNWKEESEEIEVSRNIEFTEYDGEMIKNEIRDMLKLSQEKAIAKPTPDLKTSTIILSGEPVKEFLKYYYINANGKQIYDGISTYRVGECVQGQEVIGEKVNLLLDPKLENSTYSAPYDEDGVYLKKTQIIEDGVLKRYWGDMRHSYYLGIEPTGNIKNFIVKSGSKSIEEMKASPYIELISFSDFQMDPMTGDFGGEIRLGWYFDGENTVPITSGSISGNIKEVEKEMYFSSETQKLNNFLGPKTIELSNVSLAGIE